MLGGQQLDVGRPAQQGQRRPIERQPVEHGPAALGIGDFGMGDAQMVGEMAFDAADRHPAVGLLGHQPLRRLMTAFAIGPHHEADRHGDRRHQNDGQDGEQDLEPKPHQKACPNPI